MRIDKLLAEKYGSRTKAVRAIEGGLVRVNGQNVMPSYEVKEGDRLDYIESAENYVSAGGFKLAKALKEFRYSVEEKIFADIGASTGGFTDCLFQHGAKKVYCIDVGENQLDPSLLCKNIVVIDNFNARNLNSGLFSDRLDGAVIDVSFISLTYILGALSNILENGAHVFALIKPQFECECRKVGKHGVVRDENLRKQAIEKVLGFAISCGLAPIALTVAPILAGKNIEYVALLEKGGKQVKIEKMLKTVKLN